MKEPKNTHFVIQQSAVFMQMSVEVLEKNPQITHFVIYKSSAIMLVPERCQSGRLGRSRKPLLSSDLRGFESHPLRLRILNENAMRRNLREIVQQQLGDLSS